MAQAVPAADYKTEFVPIGAKAAITATGAKKFDDAIMVPLDQIVIPEGLNVRVQNQAYEDRIEEVTDSIVENGFYRWMPLKGYAGKDGEKAIIYCTGGFTRLEAAKRARKRGAPIEAVPMVLSPAGTSMADITLALAMDNTGAPLKPYERGLVAKRLIGFGWEEKVIAKKMTVSLNYVKDLLFLHSLPEPLKQMVIDDKASAGHVIALAKEQTPAKALETLREAVAEAGEEAPPVGAPEGVDTGGAEGRVRPKRTRKPGVLAKKVIMAAIDYAIALPGDGIEFLSRWRKGDKDALAEVESTMKKKPRQKKAAPPAKGKGGAKAGAKRGGKKNAPAPVEPAQPAAALSAAEVTAGAVAEIEREADRQGRAVGAAHPPADEGEL